MKKNVVFLLAAALVCVSCTWNDEPEFSEDMKAYYQTHSEQEDSVFTDNDADSTWVFNSASSGRSLNASSSTSPDSARCDLLVEGRLIVDGGTSTDISDTYVTVEKITVRVWIDGRDSVMVSYPAIDDKVAEPGNVLEWDTMPECVKYRRKLLSAEPVTITYKESFYAEVEVCYILRVRDTKLAAGCTADRYWNTVSCESSSMMGGIMSVLVPLELVTIKFSASVGDYNS